MSENWAWPQRISEGRQGLRERKKLLRALDYGVGSSKRGRAKAARMVNTVRVESFLEQCTRKDATTEEEKVWGLSASPIWKRFQEDSYQRVMSPPSGLASPPRPPRCRISGTELSETPRAKVK